MAKDYQSIDFDLNLNDYRKSLILVKYLNDLNDDFQNDYALSSEYDGSLGTHATNDKCKFCNFYSVIENTYSRIEINNPFINSIVKPIASMNSLNSNSTNQQQNSKTFVYVRYKSVNYPKQLLDLCEYQPWRSAYALICYAVCSTQAELLSAIKRFVSFKHAYKKTLIESKLFVVLSKNGSDFFRSIPTILQSNNSSSSLASLVKSSTSSLTPPAIPKKISFEEDTISVSDNSDSVVDFNNNMRNETGSDEYRRPSLVQQQKFDIIDGSDIFNKTDINFDIEFDDVEEEEKTEQSPPIDENNQLDIELQNELKSLENNIIYFEDEDIEKNPRDSTKLKTVMNEIVHQIYIKIFKQADLVNSNDDKQINYYSEYLKLPSERSKLDGTDSSTSSLLQLKLINKKKTAGRMNKYRADLWLLLNSIENSFVYYFKAYNTLKKEQDVLWASSALFGLCLTSCYYSSDRESSFLPHVISSKSVPVNLSQLKENSFDSDSKSPKKSTKSLEVFKNKFKRQFSTSNKELEDNLIKPGELYSNFRDILGSYNKSADYSFLEFEFCLMMSKYFIEKGLPKNETYFLINNCIYMNSLNIKEETRVSITLNCAENKRGLLILVF